MNEIDIKQAKCTKLSFCPAVSFLKKNDAITGFELDGYTGAVVERWWGKLVVNLEGISSKQKMPIFRDHNPGEIVGYSTQTTNDGSFKVKGVFSKSTEAAREVMALAAEDFPWQASIGVSPKSILELKSGASMKVNGFDLEGPAEIWMQSEVYETSFVPLGADGNTSAAVFSNIQESVKPADLKADEATNTEKVNTMTLEELKAKFPELVAEIVKEATEGMEAKLQSAKAGEMARIKSIHEQNFPGHESIVEAAMFDGVSLPGDVAIKLNAAIRESLKKAGADLSGDAPTPVNEPANNGEVLKGETKQPETEEEAKAIWNKNAKLQSEFMSFEDYFAFSKTNSRFKVRIQRGEK